VRTGGITGGVQLAAPLSALVVLASLVAGCGSEPSRAVPTPVHEARWELRFPSDALGGGGTGFGFLLDIDGGWVTDADGLCSDWILTIGPGEGYVQHVSGHCLHGTSGARQSSSLPSFVIEGVSGRAGAAPPGIDCRLLTTDDFESFDTLGCPMSLTPLPADAP